MLEKPDYLCRLGDQQSFELRKGEERNGEQEERNEQGTDLFSMWFVDSIFCTFSMFFREFGCRVKVSKRIGQ